MVWVTTALIMRVLSVYALGAMYPRSAALICGQMFCLTTFGAVEEDPDRQVAGELFETVDHTGRDEQDVGGPEAVALVSVPEPARAMSHHVQLVAGVRRLGIVLTWGIEFNGQGAVAKQLGEPLTARPR
jgi:hypothetical protein